MFRRFFVTRNPFEDRGGDPERIRQYHTLKTRKFDNNIHVDPCSAEEALCEDAAAEEGCIGPEDIKTSR